MTYQRHLNSINLFRFWRSTCLAFLLLATASSVIVGNIAPVVAASSASDIVRDFQDYAGTGVGRVETYPVGQAWGVAILIPQIHRAPGSRISDARNDQALRTQTQISTFLPSLLRESRAPFLLIEGEIYGASLDAKMATLEAQNVSLQRLRQERIQAGQLFEDSTFPARSVQRFLQAVDRRIQSQERELLLTGAPFALRANGQLSVELLGSEHPETRQKSTEIVRTYLYLQDRLAAVTSSSKGSSRLAAPSSRIFSSGSLSELVRIQESFQMKRAYQQLLTQANAQENVEATDLLHRLNDLLVSTSSATTTASRSPSRSTNPYLHLTNPVKVRSLLRETEQALQQTVVTQRTNDAVEYFTQSLRERNAVSGVIQFGAGHTQDFIDAFRERGIATVVVLPEEVSHDSSVLRVGS